ncbi:MAG: transcription-repair coupling factor [Patescibacteria group bacterium]
MPARPPASENLHIPLPAPAIAALRAGRRIHTTGVPEISAQVAIIAEALRQQPRTHVLWLVDDIDHQSRVVTALCALRLSDQYHTATEITPPVLANLLTKTPTVLVLTPRQVLTPLPEKKHFGDGVLTLRPGTAFSTTDMSRHLVEHGYMAETMVSGPGEFARRGGLLDVFPVGANHPVRVEFDDRTIATLHAVDHANKAGAKLPQVTVPPARMPARDNDTALVQYLDRQHTLMVVTDADDVGDDDRQAALGAIHNYPTVSLRTFGGGEADVAIDARPAPLYAGQYARFVADAKQWKKTRVVVLTARKKQLEALCKEHDIPLPECWEVPYNATLSGFKSAPAKLLVLTDREIFPRDQPTVRTRGLDTSFLAELKTGDYAVHLDHGIGLFRGMRTDVVNGVAKEYFVLEYAEKDRLSVPVELAEKLSKYIGVSHPPLHRLHGSNWYQVTRKVREDTRQLAKELVKLYAARELVRVRPMQHRTAEERALADSFPYDETPDQMRAIEEVFADLQGERPMDRLVCGDVGFGKTEVAIRAAYKAAANGYQVAVLSPTTILTQQHYDTFNKRLAHLKVNIGLLSRFESMAEQDETIAGINRGDVQIVIGTHRLLSKDVHFKNLGLIIIDEEQRFGVGQKERLKQFRLQAHVLTMSATPIPRTLNFVLSNLRDVSMIETPPEGRQPIETTIAPYSDNIVLEALDREFKRNGQAYFLYNNVETIHDKARELQQLFPKARIGVAHGQLPEDKLADVMHKFDAQELDLLVCSTIIENGLDLPNVNTLIVDQAPKFGLSQLYQLRGRIGRGNQQAFAYFLYHSQKLTGDAKQRLVGLEEAKALGSGMQVALRDLEIRGTGNILGNQQHGHVAALGLGLYTRLLAQEIAELKTGAAMPSLHDVTIDLPLSVGIPQDFEPDERNRLRIYQDLANMVSVGELWHYHDQLTKERVAPPSLESLFKLLELKLLAQKTDITNIQLVRLGPNERLIVRFLRPIDVAKLKPLFELVEGWQLAPDQLKIDKSALGKDWVAMLKKIIGVFEKDSGHPEKSTEKKAPAVPKKKTTSSE